MVPRKSSDDAPDSSHLESVTLGVGMTKVTDLRWWHTAAVVCGVSRMYCACTHDGYKVIDTILLVIVL